MLDEAWMLGEVVRLAVFQHEKATLLEEIATQDDVGQLGYLRQSVWRVCKDEVELLATFGHELKGIASDGQSRCILKLVEILLDESVVTAFELHTDDTTAASTDEFKRNAARSREEIESRRRFVEVDISLQDIEEILLRKVRSRACREATRHLEVSAFVFACNDSHSTLRRYSLKVVRKALDAPSRWQASF